MLKAASAALKIMLSEATGAAGDFREARTILFNVSTETSNTRKSLVRDKPRIGLLYSEERATESQAGAARRAQRAFGLSRLCPFAPRHREKSVTLLSSAADIFRSS